MQLHVYLIYTCKWSPALSWQLFFMKEIAVILRDCAGTWRTSIKVSWNGTRCRLSPMAERKSFPRGGAPVLSQLERRQTEQLARREVLFEVRIHARLQVFWLLVMCVHITVCSTARQFPSVGESWTWERISRARKEKEEEESRKEGTAEWSSWRALGRRKTAIHRWCFVIQGKAEGCVSLSRSSSDLR